MARLQILELPMRHLGEVSETPFVLVIDEVEMEDITTADGMVTYPAAELTQVEADTMARSIGAVGAIVTRCTLEVN